MKEKGIKPLWALLLILAIFPIVGGICAISCQDVSMFYVSLTIFPLAVVAVVCIVLFKMFIQELISKTLNSSWQGLTKMFSKKK